MSDPALRLLTQLRDLDVRVWADGDRLRCSAPQGVLTDELRAELGARKADVLRLLSSASPLDTSDRGHAEAAQAPLSFSQQRLWFLDQLHPGSAEYNIPGATRLTGTLDVGAMERALAEIVRRHASLRTVFATADGVPVQVISSIWRSSLPVHDLRSIPADSREPHARQLLQDEARRPFDLARGPLFRAALYRTQEQEYLLMLVVHHIVSDGWSSAVFVRELCSLYEAFVAGKPSPLPELPMQYADFARWQQQWLQGDALERELSFWTRQLDGRLPVLELPTDRPRPAMRTSDGAVFKTELLPALSGALTSLSRREGVTLFMTLLAGFDLLLCRYTAQEDILVGTPIANRSRAQTEGLIGLFANTLVLRADVSGNPTVRGLLQRVRETALAAYAHQDVPFAKLVEVLKPERTLGHSPLVQVMFALQNLPVAEFVASDLQVAPMPLETGTAKFDLTVTALETVNGLQFWWEYRTDLFEAATVGRMGDSLEAILTAMAADPEARIDTLPVMGPAERHKIVGDWNDTAHDYPHHAYVHALVEAQARRTPTHVALEGDGGRLTYAELDRRADDVAAQLRACGVRTGMLVGLHLERTVDAVAALLGVLKTGAAYVPMDPAYPHERLSFMGEDAGIAVLVTSARLRDQAPVGRWRVVTLDSRPRGPLPPLPLEGWERPDLAYVIYTSGSTGKPKGVAIPHRAVVNFLVSMQREPGLTADDVLLAVTTLSFDIAVLELLLPLTVGGRVVLASRATAVDGRALATLLAESRATVMQATPATWQMLIDSGWGGDQRLKVFCGGDALSRDLAMALLERAGEVWNLYGPTETTIWSSVEQVRRDAAPAIGRPIANTQMYVLDAQEQPVPVGVAGELYIGGDGLARGYWNRPELTAERFVPDPFSDTDHARLYRTGDRARYRADGAIEYLGRADHQVKVRGFRIELGEIEAALRAHPGVRDAAVVAEADGAGSKRLVAYLVAAVAEPNPEELRTTLRSVLPDYMVPSAFVTLDALPLTANGKVDRQALSAAPRQAGAEADHAQPDERYAPPGNDVERAMTQIWSEVLGVDQVGVVDSFFDLGGHSLSATRLIARLRSEFGVDLPVQSIFVEPTIRGLSKRILYDASTHTYRYVNDLPQWKSLVPIQPRGRHRPLFAVVGFNHEDETTLIASRLIPHLGLEQPIYGVRPRWLDGSSDPYRDVQEMARECLAEMRTIQASGPYRLAGYCVAGSVALEIAQLLIQQGEHLEMLAMVDAGRPCALRTFLARLDYAWRRGRHMASVIHDLIRSDRNTRRDLVRHIIRRKSRSGVLAAVGTAGERFAESVRDHGRIMLNYRARPYRGDITLIVSEEYYRVNKYMGWHGIEGGVTLHKFPGDHQMLLTLHAKELAQILRDRIDAAPEGRSFSRTNEVNGPSAWTWWGAIWSSREEIEP